MRGSGPEAAELAITLPLELPVDPRTVREMLWLRLVAYVLGMLGGIWIMAAGDGWLATGLGALALLISGRWLTRTWREHAVSGAHESALRLTSESIEQRQGTHTTTRAWSDVRAVLVDEDRLVVTLPCHAQTPLIVEPIYGGLGVYGLRDLIARVHALHRRPAADASSIERG